MSCEVVRELPVKVSVANTLNIQIVGLINFNLIRLVHFGQSICPPIEFKNRSVGVVLLELW